MMPDPTCSLVKYSIGEKDNWESKSKSFKKPCNSNYKFKNKPTSRK